MYGHEVKLYFKMEDRIFTELIFFITAKYKFRLNLNIQNMHNIERTSNKIIYVLILAHHKLGSI